MKRMTYFVMALALVLGLVQCKKEQPETPQNEANSVMITLVVKGNNNAKADVDPPEVTFENGDEIIVACNGHYVGTLTHNGTIFIGDIENATIGQYLYFYFFGNVTPQFFGSDRSECTVYIGDQTGDLPVISMGPSDQTVPSARDVYTATLENKCSLMKFNVTTASTAPICIKDMNNFVNVSFEAPVDPENDEEEDGFSYEKKYDGMIKMHGVTTGNTETWAIVLPQDSVGEGDAYTENGYRGTRPAIGEIGSNQYFSHAVAMTLNPSEYVTTPLTFEAKTAGATVTLSKAGTQSEQAPSVSLEININDGGWSTYTVGTTITLSNVGDKVMFRGTNVRYATGTSAYHKFSLGDDCYVYGNIMSLIDATGYVDNSYLDAQETGYFTFESLFEGCTRLYNHPQKPLVLPAIGLTGFCYSHMFKGCTNLTVAPELLVDDLRIGCYSGMFEGCTSLTESPVLRATKLVQECYSTMFSGCSNLSHVTCLAETGINYLQSTSGWLSGVATSGTFTRSASLEDSDWPTGNNGIPNQWSVNYY